MGSSQEASRQEIEIRDVEGERQRVVSGTGRRGCGGRGRGGAGTSRAGCPHWVCTGGGCLTSITPMTVVIPCINEKNEADL